MPAANGHLVRDGVRANIHANTCDSQVGERYAKYGALSRRMPQMMDDARGASVAKRRLSRILAALRVESGYTADHVCGIVNWGLSTAGRFQATHRTRHNVIDYRYLRRLYHT